MKDAFPLSSPFSASQSLASLSAMVICCRDPSVSFSFVLLWEAISQPASCISFSWFVSRVPFVPTLLVMTPAFPGMSYSCMRLNASS